MTRSMSGRAACQAGERDLTGAGGMRIVVIEPIGQGGLIHYSFNMCRGLAGAGADVTLVCSTDYELAGIDGGFAVEPVLRLWDARHRSRLPAPLRALRRGFRGIRYVAGMARVVRRLGRRRPDAVLFGEMRFEVDRWFVRHLARRGIIVADVVHDVRPFDRNRRTTAVVQEDLRSLGRIYRLFDVVFVHGRENRAEFLDLYDVAAERVVDIPLGNLDVSRLVEGTETAEALRGRLGLAPVQPVLLFFGTVSKYKGLEDLIDVFPAVQRATGAVLVVAGFPGKDVDIDAVVERASSLGIADHVRWILEYVPNELIRPLMELADVVVLPYRSISDSGVLKVAMSYARPVVATRVGGLPDVVVDGVTGLLVDPGDADALEQACIELLSDPPRRVAMGVAAQELTTQRYGFDAVAATVMAKLRGVER